MHLTKSAPLALAFALLTGTSAIAQQRVLDYYADFDAGPLAAWETLIADFEAANPEIDVVLQNFDHKGTRPRSVTF